MESEWLDTRNQKPRKLGQKRFVTSAAFPPTAVSRRLNGSDR